MPKILPWRTVTYPCVDCGRPFLPPVGSQRSLVIRTGTILCLACKAAREAAYASEVIPCEHCGRELPRAELLYGKSYKVTQMVCPDCYALQHDPFDELDPEDEEADREAGFWW
jgi:DNA-directed RNA polymerase subunit RPC12/RpoP